MRHPAQGIRHTTSVAKQSVESDCIRSNSFFFWLYFFRVFYVNVFSAQPALQRAAPHSWASSPQRLSQCPRRQTRQVRSTRSNLASHILATIP